MRLIINVLFPAFILDKILGNKALAAGESALAELRFSAPVFAFAGDRFVIRDWSKRNTLAGGSVTRCRCTSSRWVATAPKASIIGSNPLRA